MTRPQLRVADASRDLVGRINLALSVLQHGRYCRDCAPRVDLARRALRGESIEQLASAQPTTDSGK